MSFSFGFLEVSFSIAITSLFVVSYLFGYVRGRETRDRELWASLKEVKPVEVPKSQET